MTATMSLADDSVKPAHSRIPSVDRQLLLGFLADNSTMTLIDARSPAEFAEQHLPGAINIPFDAAGGNETLLPDDVSEPVVIYCGTGRRASMLRDELRARGYTNVQVLPREQIHWQDDFMVFNCSTESTAAGTAASAEPKSADSGP